jgi:hypothetical protein
MGLVNLKDVKNVNSEDDGPGSSTYTPPYKFANYFILILKLLGAFILFCWTTTSNYLNSLYIDTNASYPISKSITPSNNPYATRFDPGPVNMSNKTEIETKVKSFAWWWERTQQSSYQLGGTILHNIFDFFKERMKGLDPEGSSDTASSSSSSSTLVQFFIFLKWLLFGLVSNAVFILCFMLLMLMWVPGFLGGVTAFMPITYSISSPIWKIVLQAGILFLTFMVMTFVWWITLVPVIYEFFYLLYLVFIKQLNDNSARFGAELMKRMKQLVFIYIFMAVIFAFSSEDLPNETKTTVGVLCGASLLYAAYTKYQSNKQA